MVVYSEKCTIRLDGKVAIVTGANTGIGKETAIDFYKRGAIVIMACRNLEKAEKSAKEIVRSCQTHPGVGKLAIVELDLCNLKSVRECSEKILAKQDRIDLLINNAGIMAAPYGKTDDGFEMHFGTNHVGHFLFTLLLLPTIIQSTPARILNISSIAHAREMDFNDMNWEKKDYSSLQAYGMSKLANILFTNELHRRLKDANIEGVNVYSLHPGVIATELDRHFTGVVKFCADLIKPLGKTPLQGVQTTIYCAVDENAGKESGLYYSNCKAKKPRSKALNTVDAKKLWEISLDMVNLPNYNIVKHN